MKKQKITISGQGYARCFYCEFWKTHDAKKGGIDPWGVCTLPSDKGGEGADTYHDRTCNFRKTDYKDNKHEGD